MIRQVINYLPMNANYTSEWIESTIRDYAGKKKGSLANVQIIWEDVSANPDSIIRIEMTNDLQYKSLSGTYSVDSIDNRNDTKMISLATGARYVRFIYTANSVTSGWLSINMNYE